MKRLTYTSEYDGMQIAYLPIDGKVLSISLSTDDMSWYIRPSIMSDKLLASGYGQTKAECLRNIKKALIELGAQFEKETRVKKIDRKPKTVKIKNPININILREELSALLDLRSEIQLGAYNATNDIFNNVLVSDLSSGSSGNDGSGTA